MTPWNERPPEVARLLNPGFCAAILVTAIVSHEEECKHGLPFPLAYMVFPLVLHKPTRDLMPPSKATRLHVWLLQHSEVRVGLAERTRSLLPFTSEAIRFLSDRKAITYANDRVASGPNMPLASSRIEKLSLTTKDCFSRSRLVGRWLAASGRPSRVFSILGLTP